MGTALIYLVVLLVVAAVFFAGASAVFGRGEELAPIPKGATPTWLPDHDVQAGHVRAVRFQQAVRGYKMAEVDWVLEQLAGELDRQASASEGMRTRIVELESAVAGAKQADVVKAVRGAGHLGEVAPPGSGTEPPTPASEADDEPDQAAQADDAAQAHNGSGQGGGDRAAAREPSEPVDRAEPADRAERSGPARRTGGSE